MEARRLVVDWGEYVVSEIIGKGSSEFSECRRRNIVDVEFDQQGNLLLPIALDGSVCFYLKLSHASVDIITFCDYVGCVRVCVIVFS